MTPERWAEIERLYHAALERDAAVRGAFLADACEDDDGLRREVESLLAHASDAAGFMSTPATARAGEFLGDGVSLIGRTLGPYAIHARLGAGEMGEVYQARDTKLGRDVAIKILPRVFTSDPGRLGRFEREARVLASLNHPHIGAIYGLDALDGTPALVLELVEGDTLAERIAKGPLAVGDALPIARQIAEALEAAHDRGVVHRDLKPANIKITPAGVVKVLDFGLAKAAAGDEVSADFTHSPTATSGTREGTVLGTPAYMSPEQARGLAVDKRTDVWAFGCVLLEMLSGRPAFAGHTVSDVMANVLQREPDWTALPASTPPAVRSLLRRCVQKEPSRRLRDIADARFQIEETLTDSAAVGAVSSPAPARYTRERLLWMTALVIALMAGVAGGSRYLYLRTAQAPAEEVRLEINAPPTIDPTSLAISPDGKTLVFAATSDGQSRLWLRPLDGVSGRPLVGTENARFPFWSPDSRSVGFSANAQLKRVDIDSGSVRVVVSKSALGGGAWNSDGTILYDSGPGTGLYRVSAENGQPTLVVPSANEAAPTRSSNEAADPAFPQFLPDQRHFLFYATGTAPGIYVAQLGEPDTPRRIIAAQAATYTSEHLLFVQQGALFAQAFDSNRLQLTGQPTMVAEHVGMGQQAGEAAVSASAAGPIVYRTGPLAAQSQFVWFDRSGKALETVAGSDIGDGYNSSLSPDGRRLALSSMGPSRAGAGGVTTDIWLLDLSRGVSSRFTFDPAFDLMPVWSPDGSRIAFGSNRRGSLGVYVKPVTGPGADELLFGTDSPNMPCDWSPDGRFILFVRSIKNEPPDIWALPLDGDRKAFPVVQTMFGETNAYFSPDGKWIAYQSNESGRVEIYVQPFPGPGSKTLISGNGGIQARWRHDGKEIFFLGSDNALMAAPIRLSAPESVEVGTPVSLFATHLSGTPRNVMGRHYMVARDGQRFLMDTVKEVALPFIVVLNWKPKP